MQAGPWPDRPSFLALPERPTKPRSAGLTHVIDHGLPLDAFEATLDGVGHLIDVWKFGYGLAYVDGQVEEKVKVLGRAGVKACPGGTLAEVCWLQRRSTQYLDWLARCGFGCVEISSGASGMPGEAKRRLIADAASRGFEVFSEIGSKDPDSIVEPDVWADEAAADLDVGATWVVAEGRDSGTVGLYNTEGDVRATLVDALETSSAAPRIIYEAPRRAQQAWLIRHVGPNVSLGNVSVGEVPSVEALRLGLRADTMGWSSTRLEDQCSTS